MSRGRSEVVLAAYWAALGCPVVVATEEQRQHLLSHINPEFWPTTKIHVAGSMVTGTYPSQVIVDELRQIEAQAEKMTGIPKSMLSGAKGP